MAATDFAGQEFMRQGYDYCSAFINPLVALRASLAGEPFRITAVQDGQLVDEHGRKYADFLAGWGTQALGHRPAAIAAALQDFLSSDTPSFYTSGLSPHAGQLAATLQQRTGYDSAFFASGGSEAIEAALKLARASSGRTRIGCVAGAYHGCTYGSLAMMAPGPYRMGFGPHLPHVDALPYGDCAALDLALNDPDLAAIVVEPVQIEAGVRVPSQEWLALACRRSSEQGVLLIADEIQTGLGRCGHFLLSETWPRRPDVVVLGKALGGGMMPLSAMLTRRAVFDRAYGSFERAEVHASTFSGNALACVAGLAMLQQLDQQLIDKAGNDGDYLLASLRDELGAHPLVAAIRGQGLLCGIELRAVDHPYFSFDYLGLAELAGLPAIGLLTVQRLQRDGFLTQISGHDWRVLRLHPPLTTSRAQLAEFVASLKRALDYLWALQ